MADAQDIGETVASALEAAGQSHVLQPPPPPEKRDAFLRELHGLDLPALERTFEQSLAHAQEARHVEPFTDVTELSQMSAAEVAQLRADGLALIAAGKTAALLLAGGQGTRLGSSAPKGCYDIGMPSGKSLFQYHAERIAGVRRLAAAHAGVAESDVRLPFLVMTSDATDAETRAFFAEHKCFGLPPDDVVFFAQSTMPCFTLTGELLRSAPGELAAAPNGNGGVYVALRDSGVLARLQRDGVTGIFQFGVDNVLCHVADPTFLGFCQAKGADCALKTVAKSHAHEAVGVLAKVNGRAAVVEYSELSKEMAEATAADGTSLLYSASHICVNWFAVGFVASFVESLAANALPWHVAKKKIPYLAPDGATVVQPEAPNGVKLELFIFDTFPHASRLVALQVARGDEFAPVKNAPGATSDSPDTARALFSALCRRRLLAAGATVAGGGDDDAAVLVELSPLLSYQGEGLGAYSGKQLEAPLHLHS